MRSVIILPVVASLSGCGVFAPAGPELCEGADGSSPFFQVSSGMTSMMLFAWIDLPSAGYTVSLEDGTENGTPMKFRLMCTPPADAGAAVITRHGTRYDFGARVDDEVLVEDAKGFRKVVIFTLSLGEETRSSGHPPTRFFLSCR